MLQQQIANGLMIGAIYGLIAVAYTLIYGIIELVNFAFDAVFMYSAFAAALLLTAGPTLLGNPLPTIQLPFIIVLPVAIAAAGLLGVVIERLAYRPLRHAPKLAPLISALGVSTLLKAAGQTLFGTSEWPFPDPLGGKLIFVFGAAIPAVSILIMAVALLAMGLLTIIVRSTAIGRAMRATAQDAPTAALLGIDVDRVIVVTFFIGSALTGLSGVLYAGFFQFAQPQMGFIPSLKGLVAAVFGGIGNIPGAFLGGLVLGMVETLGTGFIPGGPEYRDVIAFLVLGLLLWLRPQGLLGTRLPERA